MPRKALNPLPLGASGNADEAVIFSYPAGHFYEGLGFMLEELIRSHRQFAQTLPRGMPNGVGDCRCDPA